jgi:hypothetical protein
MYLNGNIWVKGMNIQNINLKTSDDLDLPHKSFNFGYIFPFQRIDSSSLKLDIESTEGEYITIGSLSLDENSISRNEIKVNDLEIMGILSGRSKEICFNLEDIDDITAQINGIIFTQKAKTYFIHEDKQVFDKEIRNGIIFEHVMLENEYQRTYCISHSDTDESESTVIFSFQLTTSSVKNYNQLIYAPQLPGVIYKYFLQKGEIAVFRGMKPKNGAKEVNYNLRAIKGYPDMRFAKDNNFPHTNYNPTSIINLDNPHHANRMSAYNFYLNDDKYPEFDPLTAFQPLIVVQCLNGTNEKESNSLYCEFETSIYSDLDRINLIEEETFSKYILEGKQDLYTFNFESQGKLKKIYLDLITFSGDVNLELDLNENQKA